MSSDAEYVTRDVCSTDEELANVFYRPFFQRQVVSATSELGRAIEHANYVASPKLTPKSAASFDSGNSLTSLTSSNKVLSSSPLIGLDRMSPRGFADMESILEIRSSDLDDDDDEKSTLHDKGNRNDDDDDEDDDDCKEKEITVRLRTELSRKHIFEEELAEESAAFEKTRTRRRSSYLKKRQNRPSLRSRIHHTRNAVKVISSVVSQNTNKIDYVSSSSSTFRGSHSREMYIRHAFASTLASLMKEVRCYMSNGDKDEAQRYAVVENFEFSKLLNKDKWLGSDTTNPFSKRPAEREFCTRLYDSMAFQIDIRTRAISNQRDMFDRWCRRKLENILTKLRNVKANRNLLVTSSSKQSRENRGIPLDGLKGYLWKLPRGVDPWSKKSMFNVGRGYRWKRVWCEIDVIENQEEGKFVWYVVVLLLLLLLLCVCVCVTLFTTTYQLYITQVQR